MYRLIILQEANNEFKEAAQWYEEKSEGLGDRFIDIIQKKLQLIQQYPERYPMRKDNFREALVYVFPYTIIYTCYKKEKTITINSIFHTARNPKTKYRNK